MRSWKARVGGREGSVDLVGGDVEEAEGGALRFGGERVVEGAGGAEEGEGAVDVGAEEGFGAVMERSTWLSAAKWRMARWGGVCARRFVTSFASQMSPWMKV